MGKWAVVATLSGRMVDEYAEMDGQRFFAEDVAEESPVMIGASLCVGRKRSLRFWEQGLVSGRKGDHQGWLSYRTCEDDGAGNNWFKRRMCSASMRRNWSFHALISRRRVSSRRKHWSFHHWASWRSCTISSAWCLFCVVECGGKEGGKGNSAEYSQKSSMG